MNDDPKNSPKWYDSEIAKIMAMPISLALFLLAIGAAAALVIWAAK